MRILHVSLRDDIRALKQALVILDRGHQVELAAPAGCCGYGYNRYTVAYAFGDNTQLKRVIRQSTADIIHVHSDPNWLVTLCKDAAGDRAVIHDVHDVESMRTGQPPDQAEIDAFQVDGIIHVSEPCRAYAERLHGAGKPTLINYSMAPGMFFDAARHPNWDAIAYEGGLTSLVTDANGYAYYRNMSYFTQKFMDAGFQVSLFAVGEDELDMTYEQMGAFVTKHLPFPTMLTGLRLHGFGFVGTPVETPLLKAAMPNKLFEYISQGVVPVCWNTDAAGEFVEKHGIGIWLKGDLDCLHERLQDGPALRHNLLKIRDQFKMEAQADALESFYRSFVG